MSKLNSLEKEIIHHLTNNVYPLDLNYFVSHSKITKYDRRMNAALLDLVDKGLIFAVTPPSNLSFNVKYKILGLAKNGAR